MKKVFIYFFLFLQVKIYSFYDAEQDLRLEIPRTFLITINAESDQFQFDEDNWFLWSGKEIESSNEVVFDLKYICIGEHNHHKILVSLSPPVPKGLRIVGRVEDVSLGVSTGLQQMDSSKGAVMVRSISSGFESEAKLILKAFINLEEYEGGVEEIKFNIEPDD